VGIFEWGGALQAKTLRKSGGGKKSEKEKVGPGNPKLTERREGKGDKR